MAILMLIYFVLVFGAVNVFGGRFLALRPLTRVLVALGVAAPWAIWIVASHL